MEIDFAYFVEIMPRLLAATVVTLRIAALGFALSLLLGLLLAVLRLRGKPVLAGAVLVGSEFIRLTPLMVQLFFAFYVLPEFGVRLPAEPTGILVIGIHYATYTSEVFRSGILAVPTGQWEAARSLGLPVSVVWMNVILPQAIRPMIPALGNFLIQMFKEVPLLSTITVYELLNTANLIAGETFRYIEVLTLTGAIFFLLSFPSSLLLRRLEAKREH